MKIEKNSGFTLLELMIAMVVMVLLATVAYPSYRESIIKTRRSDAYIALTQAVARQERWYTENNSYTNDVDDIGGDGSDNLVSTDSHYTISITGQAGCKTTVGGVDFYSCFTMTAVPVTGDGQADDSSCKLMAITNTGVKSANDKSDGTGNDTTSTCWKS